MPLLLRKIIACIGNSVAGSTKMVVGKHAIGISRLVLEVD